MRRSVCAGACAAALLMTPRLISAQEIRAGMAAQSLTSVRERPLAAIRGNSRTDSLDLRLPVPTADSIGGRKSYWLIGFVVGSVIGLVGGLQLQDEICHDRDAGRCTGADHLWFLVPTAAFAAIGAMIGSAIHRH